MSFNTRGSFNRRRGCNNAPQNGPVNNNRSNNSDQRRSGNNFRGRGRGGYRGGRSNTDAERRPYTPRPKPAYPESTLTIPLIDCIISPNSTYHFIKRTIEEINIDNPVEFQNSIDVLNNIHTEFENIRRAIMKVPVETATTIDSGVIINLEPSSMYPTKFASTFDLHITTATNFFDPYQWIFVYFNALTGFADGFSSIISSVPASYFPAFYDVARKFHICLRKVGLSLKREYLRNTYPKYFMSKQELADNNIEFTPDDFKERERIWKEYDEAKSAGIYIVADLCKMYGVSESSLTKEQIQALSDSFVEHAHEINNPEVLLLWKLIMLDPFFGYQVENKSAVSPYDFGIEESFHLLNVLPSSVNEACNHVQALRMLAHEFDVSASSSIDTIATTPSIFSALKSDSGSEDLSSEEQPVERGLLTLSDEELFEFNRKISYVIQAKLHMLEVSTTSDDLMHAWATKISLIHDEMITLYRNIRYDESYNTFSDQGRIQDRIKYPSKNVKRLLTQTINRYTKHHRLEKKSEFINLPTIQFLKTINIEDVITTIFNTIEHASLRESSSTYCSTDTSIAVELLYGILENANDFEKHIARNCMLSICNDLSFNGSKINVNIMLFMCIWCLHLPFMQLNITEEQIPCSPLLERLIKAPIEEMINESTKTFDITTPRQISVLEAFIIFIRSVRFLDLTSDDFYMLGENMWTVFRTKCEEFITQEPKLATLRWKLTDFEIDSFKQLPTYRSIVNIKG